MFRRLPISTLFAVLTMFVLGATGDVRAQNNESTSSAKNMIRIALLAPRGSVVDLVFRKMDRDMRAATNNEWGVRVYSSGVAGDEKDVIRKMRVSQMDSAIITTTGMSQVVRELAVLDTPGVITSYEDVKKIQKEMWNEWTQTFLKNNVKLIGWFPTGEYRIFTKGKITSINDFKSRRPWLWPESFILKELWRGLGANGVPLGIPDVYAALQTGMIDSYIATCITAVAMQWHTKVDSMSQFAKGILLQAWVMNKGSWDALPQTARDVIDKVVAHYKDSVFVDAKTADDAAYQKLLKRGFSTFPTFKGYEKVEEMVREKLTGRVFSKELLQRIAKVTGHQ
jgi:TRAP-type transport system periplasmic protein